MMILFLKRMGAKLLAKKALRVVYAENHCFRLWHAKAVYEYLRPVSKDNLKIETRSNVYYTGATVPSVIVTYEGEPVLATSARFIGANILGDIQVILFKKGDWTNILNNLYKEAKESKKTYH